MQKPIIFLAITLKNLHMAKVNEMYVKDLQFVFPLISTVIVISCANKKEAGANYFGFTFCQA